ncbi:MAG: hypothetical protein M5U12_31600 [Verrucomicrobia bacterium]|nr:hypothetical protein [Verrucomicrobiota bacterium]
MRGSTLSIWESHGGSRSCVSATQRRRGFSEEAGVWGECGAVAEMGFEGGAGELQDEIDRGEATRGVVLGVGKQGLVLEVEFGGQRDEQGVGLEIVEAEPVAQGQKG